MARTRYVVAAYAICVLVALGIADYLYAKAVYPELQPTPVGIVPLPNKIAWYREHASEFNLVFIGDSKTYCGIHPELLDPLLGSRSINLAGFSNWFATQLPIVQELAPFIPRDATVVFSVGLLNFEMFAGTEVPRVYPVGIWNALRYAAWGLPFRETVDNLLYYSRPLHFLAQRGDIRKSVISLLDRALVLPSIGGARAAGALAQSEIDQMIASYSADPRVAVVEQVRDGAETTSLVLYFGRGSYYRIELDTAYFRRKQTEIPHRTDAVKAFNPVAVRMFKEILRTLHAHGVRVIVNELEEAPFMYADSAVRAAVRDAMRERLSGIAANYGYPFMRVDFDRLSDEDYFDYNHMNSKGAAIFTPMLADQLRPKLGSTQTIAPSVESN